MPFGVLPHLTQNPWHYIGIANFIDHTLRLVFSIVNELHDGTANEIDSDILME